MEHLLLATQVGASDHTLLDALASSNAVASIPRSADGIRLLLQRGLALLPSPGPCHEIRFSARVLESSRVVVWPPQAVANQTIVRLSAAPGENSWLKLFGECLRNSNRIVDRSSGEDYGALFIHTNLDVAPGWWEFALSLASADGRWFRVSAVRPIQHQFPAYPWSGAPAQCPECEQPSTRPASSPAALPSKLSQQNCSTNDIGNGYFGLRESGCDAGFKQATSPLDNAVGSLIGGETKLPSIPSLSDSSSYKDSICSGSSMAASTDNLAHQPFDYPVQPYVKYSLSGLVHNNTTNEESSVTGQDIQSILLGISDLLERITALHEQYQRHTSTMMSRSIGLNKGHVQDDQSDSAIL